MLGLTAWSALQQSMRAMHESMSSIHSTGNDGEDFVRLMLPHHQAAIDMGKAELVHGQDPQMRRLAQEIIADQQSEIELMQLWLKQHGAQRSGPISPAKKEQWHEVQEGVHYPHPPHHYEGEQHYAIDR
jgi:hypothetical protein